MIEQYRTQLLKDALDARMREVTEYQVNIDNFRLAIDRVGADPDLKDFKEQLRGLLMTNMIEQKKAKVMLGVIKSQLEE